jgi:hypothetical protein
MSLELILYLISIVIKLEILLLMLICISGFGALLTGVMYTEAYGENSKASLLKWFKTAIRVLIISVILLVFIPGEKTLYTIIGTYYLKQSDIPAKVVTIINDKLDELIAKDKKED